MLRQRVITSLIIIPFLIAIVWFGEPCFTLLIAILAVLCGLEFFRVVCPSESRSVTYFGVVLILLLVIRHHYHDVPISLLITSAIVISLIWLLFRSPGERAFSSWAWTIAGVFYIGWMLGYWIDLRNLEVGRDWVFWALFVTFASDTGAFFVGRAWGRHLLAPDISPGKTWEGAMGGLMSGIVASLILSGILSLPLKFWHLALSGGIISLLAQFGDLVESLLKRNTGVKDSGKLIPGHGGVLDRADSLMFVGVVVYYYVLLAI